MQVMRSNKLALKLLARRSPATDVGNRGPKLGEDTDLQTFNILFCRSFVTTSRKGYCGTILIVLAYIIGNSSLEPLLEGVFAQIHINLS